VFGGIAAQGLVSTRHFPRLNDTPGGGFRAVKPDALPPACRLRLRERAARNTRVPADF